MKKPKCNECNSGQVYFNKNEIVCRRCGNREKIKEKDYDTKKTL